MFAWKTYEECAYHFCVWDGIVNFWWWKNLASYTIRQWLRHSQTHRCGHTHLTTKCPTFAQATISIVHREVIRAFGKWWWINCRMKTVITIAAWLTVVHHISMVKKSIECYSTISSVITHRIVHHLACTSMQHGSKSPNTWTHSSALWTMSRKWTTCILSQTIKQSNGCVIQHPVMQSINSNRGIAKENNSNQPKLHATYHTHANFGAESCSRIAISIHATSVRHNTRGFAMNSVWIKHFDRIHTGNITNQYTRTETHDSSSILRIDWHFGEPRKNIVFISLKFSKNCKNTMCKCI